MTKRDFVKRREKAWHRFETLMNRVGRGMKRINSRDVTEFSRLFRELANDLAIVRSRGWGEQLASYLNHLVSRGYDTFYVEPPGYLRKGLVFLTTGFPRSLRANLWYFAISAILFFLPLAVTWAVIQNDPALATRIIPEGQLEGAKQMYAKRKERELTEEERRQRDDAHNQQRALMAGFYVQHNTGIAFKSWACGILLGIGSVVILLYNGIAIGAIAGFVMAEADSEKFLSFVITHGAFELTAIAVAGAGGLILGNALLHPGQRSRWEALKVRGFDAIGLAMGAGVMLFIAAMIEGFWSPARIPALLKYIVGSMAWIVVALYFIFAGRGITAADMQRLSQDPREPQA